MGLSPHGADRAGRRGGAQSRGNDSSYLFRRLGAGRGATICPIKAVSDASLSLAVPPGRRQADAPSSPGPLSDTGRRRATRTATARNADGRQGKATSSTVKRVRSPPTVSTKSLGENI